MTRSKGDVLRLMARAETIKQAGQARKLRDAQTENDRFEQQSEAVNRLLKDHEKVAPAAKNPAQLTNALRIGQQLESHKHLLKGQIKQSQHKVNRAKTDLAKTGHKLDILTEKADAADRSLENE